MHSTKVEVTRIREDFRSSVNEIMHAERLVQKQVADKLGVDQSTISRWLSFEGDSDFPAPFTSLLTLQLEPLAIAILKFQADRMGYDVVKRVKVSALNGELDDEMLEIVEHLGHIVEDSRTSGLGGYKKCRARLDAIGDAVAKAKEELNTMVTTCATRVALGGTVRS
jgi:transcriptional regulator with XRE-family HTH domain